MKVRDALGWINRFAPFETAEDFDNVGLLIGDADADVSRVLFTLDVTEETAQTAVRERAELIISHHPLIFSPIKRIDLGTVQGRIIATLITNGISVIAAHTCLDMAAGGISDALADVMELTDINRADVYVRVGRLPKPVTADELGAAIEAAIGFRPRVYCAGGEPISTLAVAGGAYGEGWAIAAGAGAQAYLVGEIHHHEILEACASGLTVYDGGHRATEMPGVRALYRRYIADASAAGLTAEPLLCD